MPEETFEAPQVVEPKSTDWTKIILAAILGFGLLAGSAYAGYYYGAQQVPQPEKPTPTVSQPRPEADRPLDETPTPTPKPTPSVDDETASWETYRNESLGFELRYPEGYFVNQEKIDSVSFGIQNTSADESFPYLTISTNLTDYSSYGSCGDYDYDVESFDPGIFPCLSEGEGWGQKTDIADTTLGGTAAKSLYVTQAIPDVHFHIVQTTTFPLIEAKMFVAGGGLDRTFNQILSTFKFLN